MFMEERNNPLGEELTVKAPKLPQYHEASVPVDEITVASSSEVSTASDIAPRRVSQRSKQVVNRSASFATESELQAALTERSSRTLPQSSSRVNLTVEENTNEEYETWVEVEQILKVRRTAPFPEVLTHQTWGDRVEQYAHFVKYRDQSYWHCSWMPGSVILQMHPGMAKYYHRRNLDLVDLADVEYTEMHTESETPPNVPSSDDDDDVEDLTPNYSQDSVAPIVGGFFAPSPLKQHLKGGRHRYRYYVDNGVSPNYLFPERVLSISESFRPAMFASIRRKQISNSKPIKKSSISSMTRLREVLVKWCDLDEAHATWETLEVDLAHLDTMLSRYRRASLQPLDPCGRRLLPSFVRRWILQLASAHLSQIAGLYTLHLGEASKERIVQVHRRLSRHPPPLLPSDWQENWLDRQPAYLSQYEGGQLHAYQLKGVRWLRESFYSHVNVILADEMGLGKTIQVISMLYSLVKEDKLPGPFLIVTPLAVTMNWKREFAFWAPEMQVIVYTGDRQNRAMINEYCLYTNKGSCIPAFHVIITSYEMISLERARLTTFAWQVLVVDEAHRLKNKQCRLFRDLLSYDVEFKVLLTGTPLQNNLDELIHLLHFLDPDKFSDVQALSAQWASMNKEERAENLHTTFNDHFLRRMKRDVIKDLPKKTEVIVPLSLTPLQKRIYKMVLTKNYEALRTRNLMNPLLHLQKVCNHPYLMPSGEAMAKRVPAPAALTLPSANASATTAMVYEPQMLVEASAKLHLVMRMLRRLRDRGHRVLIFSHLISMLDIIEMALDSEGFYFERLDGSVRGTHRQSAIDRFNSLSAAPFVFLLSTRAGGEGINLASADTVILFDSDWNPYRDMQALARAHRIGQSKHVIIYRLIMRDTVEERIIHVAWYKLALTGIMDKDHSAEALSFISTPANSSEKEKDHLRLSRSEAHNILTMGLDSLFVGDDDDIGDSIICDRNQTNDGGKKNDCVGKGDTQDNEKKEVQSTQTIGEDMSKVKAKRDSIIYDDETLERLLDRDSISRVRKPTDITEESPDNFDSTPIVFSPSSNDDMVTSMLTYQGGAKQNSHDAAKGSIASAREVSSFWENLLKKRYERMLMQEAQELREGGLSDAQDPRGVADESMIIIEDSDDSDRGNTNFTAPTTAASSNAPSGSCTNDAVEIVKWAPGSSSLLCSAASRIATKTEVSEPRRDPAGLVARRRRSTRRVRPTALSLSAFHFVTRAEDEDDDMTSRPQRGNRRPRRGGTSMAIDSDEEFRPDSSISFSSSPSDDEGEPTNASGIQEAPTDDNGVRCTNENQSRSKRRKDHVLRVGGEEEFSRSPPREEEWQIADMYRQIDWQTDTTAMCSPLRDLLIELPEDVRFVDAKMTVFGFSVHERQLFLEAVMRYGLPPKGTLPPPEWLPFSLRSKPPEQLFAYTNLFMRHLYLDPKVLDAEALRWSDGVPTEGVSGVAVLSRIAMMALIRAKTIQFEDCNAIPKKFKQAVDNTFRFDIHDGGLTLLSSQWRQDMDQLSARFERLRSSIRAATVTRSATAEAEASESIDSSVENRALSVILRKWHRRHDYMLLAGIHTHGYAAFGDILKNKRFSMLLLGLAERVLTVEKADPLAEHISNACLAKEILEKHIFSPEILCFLTERLRMLEHGLVVEQALAAVVLAVQGQTKADKSPDPPASLVEENAQLLEKFSACLSKMGPIKRMKLPASLEIGSLVKRAVFDLHLLLEDLYADMPGLPAVLVCDGVDYAQPRFLIDDSIPQQRHHQTQPPSLSTADPTLPPTSFVPSESDSRPVESSATTSSEVLLHSE